MVRPSGSQVGTVNIERGPRVMAVTTRVSDVHDMDVQARQQVRVASPIRCERDATAIRRPCGLAVRDRAVGQAVAAPATASTSHRWPTWS